MYTDTNIPREDDIIFNSIGQLLYIVLVIINKKIHYSNTLKKWRENFINSWGDISKQGFDQSFKKIWDFYFSYCEAGFKSKNIDLIQFSLCNK